MSGFYKKAVVWLGLNEDYPEDGEVERGDEPSSSRAAPRPEPSPERRPEARPVREPQSEPQGTTPGNIGRGAPTSGDPLRHNASRDVSEGSVRVVPIDDEPVSAEPSLVGTVRAVAAPKTIKPRVIVPTSFNDAQMVADTFKEPKPVIVNMQNAERDLRRRLIDFASGLCYGLGGQMEKVAKDVYLLTPDDVEVADEDRNSY